MQDIYADTVSAIHFNNGVVRMMLVDQDPATLAQAGDGPTDVKPRLKQQVIMPLPGFLYMLSVVKGLMEDPKMQEAIRKYVELGLLPTDADTVPPDMTAKGQAAA